MAEALFTITISALPPPPPFPPRPRAIARPLLATAFSVAPLLSVVFAVELFASVAVAELLTDPPFPPPPPTDCAKIPYEESPKVLIMEFALLLFTVTRPALLASPAEPPKPKVAATLPPLPEVVAAEPPEPPPPPTDCAKIPDERFPEVIKLPELFTVTAEPVPPPAPIPPSANAMLALFASALEELVLPFPPPPPILCATIAEELSAKPKAIF